jgi:hypothetical protein
MWGGHTKQRRRKSGDEPPDMNAPGETFTPAELAEYNALRAEILAHPDVSAAIRSRTEGAAYRFLVSAVRCAQLIETAELDDLRVAARMTSALAFMQRLRLELEGLPRKPRAVPYDFNR